MTNPTPKKEGWVCTCDCYDCKRGVHECRYNCSNPESIHEGWEEMRNDPACDVLYALRDAVETWERQGRNEDQKWAVRNFLTGAGRNGIHSLLKSKAERMKNAKIDEDIYDVLGAEFSKGYNQGLDTAQSIVRETLK